MEGLIERRRVRVTGTVQGVGFRPFVYRAATALGLSGFVCNDSGGVLIEVEGPDGAVEDLCRQLVDDAPPLAKVVSVEAQHVPAMGNAGGFRIVESRSGTVPTAPVSVDAATCSDCVAEVDDPANRRYRYPFTNCTNCGPRYTIVLSVPYDRPATTMAGFTMCPACQAEYDDPGDRRFHAQPNACPVCGPQLAWYLGAGAGGARVGVSGVGVSGVDAAGGAAAGTPAGSSAGKVLRPERGESALQHAVATLLAGGIVAVKGIGGFHLACDATSSSAVGELRRRKARDDKPFAVMVGSAAAASELVSLSPAALAALSSPRRPIVLAPRLADSGLASGVAPGLPELGLMIAYTPLHHLLLAGVGRPLVMTSGNLADDPIAYTDEDAFSRLGELADGFLTHDRPIHIRCDDSVARAVGGGGGSGLGLQLLRRSRGYAPEPLALPREARREVLAVGAELKNTVSVAKERMVVASHHLGDLEHLSAYRAFLHAARHMQELYGVHPDVVAHDLHPEYLSTKYALELDLPAWGIQHHHAHIASCLAEHGYEGQVLGLAFDGLGWGTDGTVWGGELLVADLTSFRRVGHLHQVVMPGGVAAIREPWRMGLSWAASAVGLDAAVVAFDDPRAAGVASLVRAQQGPITSSAGRLFDAAAALLRVRQKVSYEGQAAIELEALARGFPPGSVEPYPTRLAWEGGQLVIDPRPLIEALLEAKARGVPVAESAAAFHEGIASAAVAAATMAARVNELGTVALSGGVFQNSRLSLLVARGLREAGLEVLEHRLVPPNDGGISVGQAAIAALAHSAPEDDQAVQNTPIVSS